MNSSAVSKNPRSVLVVGSGGREHAIVKALLASPSRPSVICTPGNAGIADEVRCHPVAADDIPGLVELARREAVEFVVVGPDLPLSLGLVDRLSEAGIPAYGPRADGARLEASKVFTKQLLLKHSIPTAPARVFSDSPAALAFLRVRAGAGAGPASPLAIVVKADGLALGKGVVVASTLGEAETAVREMIDDGRFGDSGRRILIEDCLYGDEASLLVVVSGRDYFILPPAQDHKRIGDGDTGPNTGGMGAYSPAEVVTPALLEAIERDIVRPSVEAIAAEGIDYRGTLFIGLMLTAAGPSVIEFNARFGDPETQVVLPRLEGDVLALLWAATTGRIGEVRLGVRPGSALCVVIAAQGYPGKFAKGEVIELPQPTAGGSTWIVHAGTARDNSGRLVSNGGRVLGVTAMAPSLAAAAKAAYAVCAEIRYPSKYFRKDIGERGLKLLAGSD